MKFDFETLKNHAKIGNKLGNWNGKPVFATSAKDLENKGSGVYYIVYDDENRIVGRDGKFYYSYGTVNAEGSVSEYSSRRRYNTQHDRADYKMNMAMKYSSEPVPAATVAVTYTPGYDISERPVADVKVEIDVEATLKKAREMTIDDLLEGFNYGL